MTLQESGIFISLKRLRTLVHRAQYCMDKSARINFGSPIERNLGEVLKDYVMAFTVSEKKLDYLDEAIGMFAVVRIDLEFCAQENLFHFPKRKIEERKDENGKVIPVDTRDEVSSQAVEIFTEVAKIDDGMCKWRASLSKARARAS